MVADNGAPDLPPEILKILSDYAVEMVRIRQTACPHLSTENIGPEMLEKVIRAYGDGLCPPLLEIGPRAAEHCL